MKEIKLYGTLLFLALVGTFVSWRRGTFLEDSRERVMLLNASRREFRSFSFFTGTQTVSMSFGTDDEGSPYPWFELLREGGAKTWTFVGNDKVDELLGMLAPFRALRNLGMLPRSELEEMKIEPPQRKFTIVLKSGAHVFDVGTRTGGARDYYVRPAGSTEVYLVASDALGHIESPESRFMQRLFRTTPQANISKVVLTAAGKSKTALQRNRLSPDDAYWAAESKPEDRNDALGNFIAKLDRLSVSEYPKSGASFPKGGVPVLTATWYGEDETTAESTFQVWRVGEEGSAEYFARSSAVRMPVKISVFAGQQLEADVAALMRR